MNTFKNFRDIKLSRTLLCISIRRNDGHRTEKRVKNTNTGKWTGICGHTGRTTRRCHMRLFTIGLDHGGSERSVRIHYGVLSGVQKNSWSDSDRTYDECPNPFRKGARGGRHAARRLRDYWRVLPPARSRPRAPIVSATTIVRSRGLRANSLRLGGLYYNLQSADADFCCIVFISLLNLWCSLNTNILLVCQNN